MPLASVLKKVISKPKIPPVTDREGRGRFGEREAEKALKKSGLSIITRNWRHGNDEIDLVCLDETILVFVEVRTRDENALAPGIHSLTQRKKNALRRVCRAYQKSLRSPPSHIRFDLVEVSLCQDDKFSLHHHMNVPLFA